MKNVRTILEFCVFLLITDISPCAAQTPIDHSFTFLDRNGLLIGYEIQYVIPSGDSLNNEQKQRLFSQTRKIASTYGREIEMIDFVFKRDSIEAHFINDVTHEMTKHDVVLNEMKIINFLVPKQIEEAMIKRVELSKETFFTRIKSYD